MINTLNFYLNGVNKQIANLKAEKENTESDYHRGLITGQILQAEMERMTLKNLLDQVEFEQTNKHAV